MTITIDLTVEADAWTRAPWPDADTLEGWFDRAITEILDELTLALPDGEIAVVLTDDQSMQTINADHRGINKPTNVLSFPAINADALGSLRQDRPHLYGDLVFASETIMREALAANRLPYHHMTHLIVHGFLHLMGYDHERDDEAEEMEALEVRILNRLGIADPYAAES